MLDKNEDFSKSVNSFHSEPIFPESLGQELSRNVGGVQLCVLEKSLLTNGFGHDAGKMTEISGKVASATSKSNLVRAVNRQPLFTARDDS